MSNYSDQKDRIDTVMDGLGYEEAPTLVHNETAPRTGIHKEYSVLVAGMAEQKLTQSLMVEVPWDLAVIVTYSTPNPAKYKEAIENLEAAITGLAAIGEVEPPLEPELDQEQGILTAEIPIRSRRQ